MSHYCHINVSLSTADIARIIKPVIVEPQPVEPAARALSPQWPVEPVAVAREPLIRRAPWPRATVEPVARRARIIVRRAPSP